jgi:anti-sigma regulatory factor (Ser/Thr protein kinase)
MAAHQLDLYPDPSAIARLNDWVGACGLADGLAEDLTFQLTLALEEGVANVLEHAFQGVAPPHLVRIQLDITEASIVAEIVDNGRAFDLSDAATPDLSLPLEERDPGGLGIHLMRSLMDEVQYRRQEGYNSLRLIKARG